MFHALQHKKDAKELRPLITPETARVPDDFYQLKPLFWALSYGASAEVLQLLLVAYPEAANEVHPTQGWTPLHYAERLDVESVKLLLARCPNAGSVQDSRGALPLHWAAEHDAPLAVVKVLVEANKDAVFQPDALGRLPARLALDAGASGELIETLQKGSSRALPSQPTEASLPIAVLFPGQGSQCVGMLNSVKSMPSIQEMLREAREILGFDLLQVCLEGPEDKLQENRYCQPAVYVAGLAGFERMKEEMPENARRCHAMAGFSVGQYAALAAAGVFSFSDGLRLVKARAEAMQEAANASQQAMLSVAGFDETKLSKLCAQAVADKGGKEVCQITAHLFQRGFTVGGTRPAVEHCKALCEKAKARQVKLLNVSSGFHTELMAPARARLEALQQEFAPKMSAPRCKVFIGSHGDAMGLDAEPQAILSSLASLLTERVHWQQCVTALQADGIEEFYECGSQRQLKAIMKRIDSDAWGRCSCYEV